jgi:hypothetical protein
MYPRQIDFRRRLPVKARTFIKALLPLSEANGLLRTPKLVGIKKIKNKQQINFVYNVIFSFVYFILCIMKTTIDIPNKLLEEAMELTGSQNRNQMIIEALKNEIIRIKRKRLIALKGTVDLGIDLDSLRDRK